ncbi:MAG TPA: protein kinase, partial [Kofleriaceae bacterium]
MGCFGDETIAAYVDGTLDLDMVVRVDHHIDGCTTCRAQLSAVVSSPVMHSFVLGSDDERPGIRGSAPTIDVLVAVADARPNDPLSGLTIGRYIVESVIGRGAMGVVVRAHDPELQRAVAIKLVAPSLRGASIGMVSGGWRARLRAEARAMARLRHPNVVAVYDVGSIGDQLFVAMELVEGESLAQRLARDRHDVLELCIGAGRGLCAAHAAGLVHGDIKPDNILVDRDGRAVIGDFGLARAIAERSTTLDGHPVVGTPVYMAPELLRGQQGDARVDQFAFAMTVYEAFAGSRPWRASSIEALLAVIEREPPVRPHAMPLSVWRVVERGLAIDPDARYRSMTELVADLERAERQLGQDSIGHDIGIDELTTQTGRPISSLPPPPNMVTASQSLEPTTTTKLELGFVTLVPGTLVGDYEIEKLLGTGAMAQVYGARHERLGKRVAI